MAKTKVKKKTKEQEELIAEESSQKFSLVDFITENRNMVGIVAGAILLIVAAFILYNNYQDQQNEVASAEMFQAVRYLEADSTDKAINGTNLSSGLLDIESDYSGTEAANLAKYRLGIAYLTQDTPDVDLGIEYLKDFDKKSNSPLAMAAYMALGFAHEDIGDPEAAAGYFEDAINSIGTENEHMAPTLLMHVGRNYETAEEPAKALKAYERIKKEFPLSSEGLRIDKYIGRVSQ